MKDISLHILDLVQNCITAGARNVTITLHEDTVNNDFTLSIADDGRGIAAENLPHVADPFFTTRKTRKVGMGLSLLKQNAEATGGSFSIASEVGVGTTTVANFILNHLDRPPLGDIAGVLVLLTGANDHIRFVYRHTTAIGTYSFDTEEVKEALDNLPLSDHNVMKMVKELINSNIETIRTK